MADQPSEDRPDPTLKHRKESELFGLMDMFRRAGVVNSDGGINAEIDIKRVISMFEKFSKKMTARTFYMMILSKTTSEVLVKFMKNGGWRVVNMWLEHITTMKEDQPSRYALGHYLKLVQLLPVDMDLLQDTSVTTPKIIRQLTKLDNEGIKLLANQIRQQWTSVINEASVSTPSTSGDQQKLKKKRHANDSGSDSSSKKKGKKDKSNKLDDSLNYDAYELITQESIKESDKKLVERTPRPSTVKVKPGKSRLGDLIASQANSSATKSAKKRKESPSAALGTDPNPSKEPINVTTEETIQSSAQNPQPIQTVQTKPSPPPKPHILTVVTNRLVLLLTVSLQESGSFMDALTAEAQAVPTKKKRRPSHTITPLAPGSPEHPTSSQAAPVSPDNAPLLSFYKDTSDERFNAEEEPNDEQEPINERQTNGNEGSREGSPRDVRPPVDHILVSPLVASGDVPRVIADPVPNHIKPILCYVKKKQKKSVRWNESQNRIKYFDLDETERVNVTRPASAGNFSDLRRLEMRGEKSQMAYAKLNPEESAFGSSFTNTSSPGQSSGLSYAPYVLHRIEGAESFRLVEPGKDSQERGIQDERQRGSLPFSYPPGFAPPFPTEAEPERTSYVKPRDIPLDDKANDGLKDFTNDGLQPPMPNPMVNSMANPMLPFMPPPSLDMMGQPLPSQIPQLNSVNDIAQPLVGQYVSSMDPMVSMAPSNDMYRPPQHPMPPREQRGGHRGGGHFRGGGAPGPSGPHRGRGRRVCRYFEQEGSCKRRQCNFLHVRSGGQEKQYR